MAKQSGSADPIVDRFGTPARSPEGVASFTTERHRPGTQDAERLGRLLEAMEAMPLPAAVDTVLAGESDGVLKRLFRPGAESWRLLVADSLRGDCLDLDAGCGTRAHLLAEVDGVDSVYAADRSLAAVQFLDRRTDYDGQQSGQIGPTDVSAAPVVPIHGTPRDLPIPTERFDTVVADLAIRGRPPDIADGIRRAAEFVADDGALITLLDGPARLTGVTRLLGVETPGSRRVEPTVADLPDALRATPRRYRRLFESVGLSDVDVHALVPSTTDPQYGFSLSAPGAVDSLLTTRGVGTNAIGRLLRSVLCRESSLNLLERGYPSFVAVARRSEGDRSASEDTDRPFVGLRGDLAIRGRSRTVVVERDGGEITHVRKVPNRRSHAPFVTNERTVPAEIERRGVDEWLRDTIPDGRIRPSRFGPTYVEPPASGEKLATRISSDPAAFRAALSAGLDWIRALQRATRGDEYRVDAAEIRAELSIPHLDLSPPTVPDSLELFSTPIQGDFQPGNVYVHGADDSSTGPGASGGRGYDIATVIDWEWGAVDGNPVVDPAFHVLWTAGLAFDGLYEGIERALVQDTPHSRIVGELVGEYCDAVGLDPRVFTTYLPYVWIRRQQYCAEIGATMHYTGQGRRRADVIERLWEHRDAIGRTFDIE